MRIQPEIERNPASRKAISASRFLDLTVLDSPVELLDQQVLGHPHRGGLNHMKTAGVCEMCGHHVGIRQKAHILAEGKKIESNLLMLCPTCHMMFDTHVKPKIFKAMIGAGLRDLPESWQKSIYEQAAEASEKARRRKKSTD
jgi:hypothetical protein